MCDVCSLDVLRIIVSACIEGFKEDDKWRLGVLESSDEGSVGFYDEKTPCLWILSRFY